MEIEDNLKKLTENFFKSLKCDVSWKDKILFVDKVPLDFERLFGKKSPYSFVFEREDLTMDSELVSGGSYLIKLIANYLESKAQTTLLKIKFNVNMKEEIKKNIDLKDYEIINILEKISNEQIYRFTFITVFQYLNEKEQLINSIYLQNKSVIPFDINNYETIEGNKTDVKLDSVKENYNNAKEKLKDILNGKIQGISLLLSVSLEKEIKRIKSHYSSQVDEINKEISDGEEKIKEFTTKLQGKSSEDNKKLFLEKIERLKQNIEKLKNSEDFQKFEREIVLLINDEKQKHSINILKNLINTTIIYYPIYLLKVSLKKKGELRNSKEINLNYNPLTKELSSLLCESCGKETNEINLCSSNHLICKNCISKCDSCFKIICNSCKKSSCSVCSVKMCSKCESICFKCSKPFCNSHGCKDSVSGKPLCNNCSAYCSSCGKFSPKFNFKKCNSCRIEVCSSCIRSKLMNGKFRNVCVGCSK
jgi:hypothetical protein